MNIWQHLLNEATEWDSRERRSLLEIITKPLVATWGVMIWFNHIALGSSTKQTLAVPLGLLVCPAPQGGLPLISDPQEATRVEVLCQQQCWMQALLPGGDLACLPPSGTLAGRHAHGFVHADPGLSPPPIGCILPTLPPTFELRVLGCGCLSGLSADQDPDLKTLGFSWPQRWHETIYPFFKHPEKVKQWSSALVRHTGPKGNQVRGWPTAAKCILIWMRWSAVLWDPKWYMVEDKLQIEGYWYFFLGCALDRFSHVQLLVTLWIVAHQAPLSMRFSRKESWSGFPFPPPGDLPNPGTEPSSLMSPALAGGFFTTNAIC